MVNSGHTFSGLNSIRFFAAITVLFHHLANHILIDTAYGDHWLINALHFAGGQGVSLFFVLSGFLITYLLLDEKEKTGTIEVKNFYIRRGLRIYPLYFIVGFIAFFILPPFVLAEGYETSLNNDFTLKLLLYVFFLPQAILYFHDAVVGCSQTWTIGIEEQFYFIWPLLVKRFFGKNILPFILVILIKFLVINAVYQLWLYTVEMQGESSLSKILHYAHVLMIPFEIEKMVIGGMAAWIFYYNKKSLLNFLFSKPIQLITIAAVIVLFTINLPIPLFSYIQAAAFAVLILNIGANPSSILKFANPTTEYLGKISYGIYMYHGIVIQLVFYLFYKMGFNKAVWSVKIPMIVSVLLLTIAVSSLSYTYFESLFLKWKKNFKVSSEQS